MLISCFRYYFDGHGKAIRPVIAMTLGHAVNHHFDISTNNDVISKQRKVAIISEMIHTASLVHDDVLGKVLSPCDSFLLCTKKYLERAYCKRSSVNGVTAIGGKR